MCTSEPLTLVIRGRNFVIGPPGHLIPLTKFNAYLNLHGILQIPDREACSQPVLKTTLIARFVGQHGANMGPTAPRWAPCWPHELCYLGKCGAGIHVLVLVAPCKLFAQTSQTTEPWCPCSRHLTKQCIAFLPHPVCQFQSVYSKHPQISRFGVNARYNSYDILAVRRKICVMVKTPAYDARGHDCNLSQAILND